MGLYLLLRNGLKIPVAGNDDISGAESLVPLFEFFGVYKLKISGFTCAVSACGIPHFKGEEVFWFFLR